MRFSNFRSVLLLIGGLILLAWCPPSRADEEMDSGTLLQKMRDAYKNAASFSGYGHYENDLVTVPPIKLTGTFQIMYKRPDLMRVDWTHMKADGEVVTSSIFSQDTTYNLYLSETGKWATSPHAEWVLAAGMGFSHGITGSVPELLLNWPLALVIISPQPPVHAMTNGVDCLVIKGPGTGDSLVEVTIDPATDFICQIKSKSPWGTGLG
jgi:hypothetical protein